MSDGQSVETSKPGRTRVRPVQRRNVVRTASEKLTTASGRVGISHSQSDHLIGTQKGRLGRCWMCVNVCGRPTATTVKHEEPHMPCRRESSLTQCPANPVLLKSIPKPALATRVYVKASEVKESHEADARKKQSSSRLDDARRRLHNEIEIITESPRQQQPQPPAVQMEPPTRATYLSFHGLFQCLLLVVTNVWVLWTIWDIAQTLNPRIAAWLFVFYICHLIWSLRSFARRLLSHKAICGTMRTISLWIAVWINYICHLISSFWSFARRLLMAREINPPDSLLTLPLREKFEEAAGIRHSRKSYRRLRELLRELPENNLFVLKWLLLNGFIEESNAGEFGPLLNVSGHVLKVFAENSDLFDNSPHDI